MKAILVIDMPDKCSNCKLSEIYMGYLECNVYGKQLITDVKPNWCPLKPLPEFRDEHYKSFSLELSQIINSENRGYNDCLQEILGEENE